MRGDLGHLFESDQVIETAITFDVDSHSNSEFLIARNFDDRDLAIHGVLHFLEAAFFLLVHIFNIGQVDAAVDTTTDETLVFEEVHASDRGRMLLQKVLFNTQDQIDNDDGTIDETDCQILEVVFECLEGSRRNLIREKESSRRFGIDLCLQYFSHALDTFSHGD